ncbi:MAG: hypothetical protein ATN35_02785 [Epulopiscium sp. Nele67-Bin004]|nr:MAG: hypothetical protein ATN35_02785 [Epulopiscium sp. Nele67-Bin004]
MLPELIGLILISVLITAVMTTGIVASTVKIIEHKRYSNKILVLEQQLSRAKEKTSQSQSQQTCSTHHTIVPKTDKPNYNVTLWQPEGGIPKSQLEPYDFNKLVEIVPKPTVVSIEHGENQASVTYIDYTQYSVYISQQGVKKIVPFSASKPNYKVAMVDNDNKLPFEEVAPRSFSYVQDLVTNPPAIEVEDVGGEMRVVAITYYGYKIIYPKTKGGKVKYEKK